METSLMKVNEKALGSLALAYMGDAVYETYIRHHLLTTGKIKPHTLHKAAIHFVSAKAQAKVIHYLVNAELLTDEEMAVYKRGRNAKSGTVPRNTDVVTYNIATGFEALLGHLYLANEQERLEQIIEIAIKVCEANE